MNDIGTPRSVVDRKLLSPEFPTHRHSPQFWEQLGRTIAAFGFLEQTLGKAIFAFTATREFEEVEELEAAYKAWLPKLERALTDQLMNLADSYAKAVRENPAATIENVDELVRDIKKAAVVRNVLCHGSWAVPDANGKSIPFFVDRKLRIFDTPIDIGYLKQTQMDLRDLICSVMDTVTHMGWQFPGGAGPGAPIIR